MTPRELLMKRMMRLGLHHPPKSNTPPQSCTTVSATDSFRKHKFNQERNGIIGPAFLDGPDGPDKPGRTGLRTGLRTATVEIVQK